MNTSYVYSVIVRELKKSRQVWKKKMLGVKKRPASVGMKDTRVFAIRVMR